MTNVRKTCNLQEEATRIELLKLFPFQTHVAENIHQEDIMFALCLLLPIISEVEM